MTFVADSRELKARFGTYVDRFRQLWERNHISGQNWHSRFWLALRDPVFKENWKSIWAEILEQEGGKLSLGTVLGIIGLILGSIGIATSGIAIGVPLVFLFVPVGVMAGNECDREGITRRVVHWAQSLLDSGSDEPQVNAPDSTAEQFATLLLLLREASEESSSLKHENEEVQAAITKLKADVVAMFGQIKSLTRHVGRARTEPERRVAYSEAMQMLRYEGTVLWQRFSAFLVVHGLLAAVLGQIAFNTQGQSHPWIVGCGCVFGVILCLAWLQTFLRGSKFFDLRIEQAKLYEPEAFKLVGDIGEKFSRGEEVTVGKSVMQIGWLGGQQMRRAAYLVIGVVGLLYLGLLASTIWVLPHS